MNSGKEFEKSIHEYYQRLSSRFGEHAKITLDDKVSGPDGARQCDITIEHEYLGGHYRTIIECKDHQNRVPILHVDALSSKLNDLGYNKGVIVARSGFQSGAIQKAKRLGIDLFEFSNAAETETDINLSLPLLHLEMQISELSVTFDVFPDFEIPMEGLTQTFSNELNTQDFLTKYVRPTTKVLSGKGYKKIKLEDNLTMTSTTKKPGRILITDHNIQNLEMYVTFKTTPFLGTLGDVNSFHIRKDLMTGIEAAVFLSGDFQSIAKDLSHMNEISSIPEYLFKGGFVTYFLDINEELPRRGLFQFEYSQKAFEARYAGLKKPSGKWLAVYDRKDIY
ncbi:restriction endonuclease [uncultured Roseibium sp.]|uniref:restriction endonuclease n=1 Tax=uncultured Roseibium sp. TaxID=1936171 RepID=UPI00261D6969|nr:restriction endonuclease [uncultured Roseibium sp.]